MEKNRNSMEPNWMNAAFLMEALMRLYPRPAWALFKELRLIAPVDGNDTVDTRIDAWAISTQPSEGMRRIAFEIKITRKDFRKEICRPAKRIPAMKFSSEFYFVAPRGLVSLAEIPEDCGLIEVSEYGQAFLVKKAPVRLVAPADWEFALALAKRAVHDEALTLQGVLKSREDEYRHSLSQSFSLKQGCLSFMAELARMDEQELMRKFAELTGTPLPECQKTESRKAR